MVTVTVNKKYLFALLGKSVSDDALTDALFAVKAGCDDVSAAELSLEINGDRPDLLSAEGVARALKGTLGLETGLPKAKYASSGIKVFVDSAGVKKRPFAVGAIIENLTLSDTDVADLFQMQEKLDMTHGRKRRKVSIGLYDLDRLTPPFYYGAVSDKEFAFTPLKSEKPMSLRKILKEHPTGVKYAYTLEDFPDKLPLLYDSKKGVLALIPIVNNIGSAVSTRTRRLYIDHTGTDEAALNASLNILCQHFADRGATVKTVQIVYGNKTVVTPDSNPIPMDLSVSQTNALLGTAFSPKQLTSFLARQRIGVKSATKETLHCLIPAYRADFLHPVDLVEEVAMGRGYNSFDPKPPSVFTRGALLPETLLTQHVEDLLIGHGLQQVATYLTTNPQKHRKTGETAPLVRIVNPVSEEYDALRSRLLPGLMEILSKNTHASYPQNLFEVGMVSQPDGKAETRSKDQLQVAAVFANAQSHFSQGVSILSRLLEKLGGTMRLERLESPKYIDGRAARVMWVRAGKSEAIGEVGELHPAVLEQWHLEMPVTAFEIKIR